MKVKTNELTGAALDWAVAKCMGQENCWMHDYKIGYPVSISTDWAQGGPIIEREEIELHVIPEIRVPENWGNCKGEDSWCANIWPQDEDLIKVSGPTPLIAAMRCYCCAKVGDEIDIPEELCQQQSS